MSDVKDNRRNYMYVVLIPITYVVFSCIHCIDEYHSNMSTFENTVTNAVCSLDYTTSDTCENPLQVTIKNQWGTALIEVNGALANELDYEYYANLFALTRKYPFLSLNEVTFVVNTSNTYTYKKRGNLMYEED